MTKTSTTSSWVRRIIRLDRRIVFLIVGITLSLPYIYPLGLPLSVGPHTRIFYDAIRSLKPGDTVWWEVSAGPDARSDLGYGTWATFKVLFRQPGVRIIFTASSPLALAELDMGINLANPQALGKVYGVDYVNLGLIRGTEEGYALAAVDLKKACPADIRGILYDSIPMLKGITGVKDVKKIFFNASGGPTCFMYVNQFLVPYPSVEGYIIPTGGNIIQCMPFYPQYYRAVLQSARGSAEFEFLSGFPGQAIATIDAISLVHVTLMGMIIFANMVYFTSHLRSRREVK